ncbi:hypothetical protein F383_01178 [Gossypium arboreum]|uniref:Uncharacterized protein n=1 Tax=Gossypium arboreum TaxID=29729 RepID=A0A0B0NKM2_GOSAR|nr:hypothetical protein F383_01178 [Gossypium arboreum]
MLNIFLFYNNIKFSLYHIVMNNRYFYRLCRFTRFHLKPSSTSYLT